MVGDRYPPIGQPQQILMISAGERHHTIIHTRIRQRMIAEEIF